ncbi:glycosyltransferase family 39 protein [Candidatus Microgenomates bacterium]|nr:glycosyltransferase family 39 protein [Candidatus Microgenomates bacterium]
MKINKLFLPLTLFLAFLLRLPSLYEPNWYGDEGIYQIIGQAMAAGRPLYQGIWDNKPPLLYLIYMIFDGNQFYVRLLSLIFMLLTIAVFYFLAKRLFKNEKAVYLSSGLLAIVLASPFLEGNIANAENFMLLPILSAMYLVVETYKQRTLWPIFLSGLLLGTAFLLKIVAIFDLAAIIMLFFTMFFFKNIKEWFGKSLSVSLGFAIPVFLTIIFFLISGGLSDLATAAFSQNVSYVGVQWLLFGKLLILAGFCFLVFLKRKKLSVQFLFIYFWLGFSTFNAFFGGRPWIHYLLVVLPAFCLLVALILEDKKLRTINIILVAILLILFGKNFWVYGKTLSYYTNFTAFLSGQKKEAEYQNFFDWYVARDYEVASYIRQNSDKNDTLFIWGDNAQIYALSRRLPAGRYTVAYHVTFYKSALWETKEAIEREKPVFILSLRDDLPPMFIDTSYSLKTVLKGVNIYARRI